MKHIKLAAAAAFVLGVAAAGSASADNGDITFTGSVTDGTCVVSGGTGTRISWPHGACMAISRTTRVMYGRAPPTITRARLSTTSVIERN